MNDALTDFGASEGTFYSGPPLRGYRYWYISAPLYSMGSPGAGGRSATEATQMVSLYAVSAGVTWSPGLNAAICRHNDRHLPPQKGCRCGFYGWYTPKSALNHVSDGSLGLTTTGHQVFGVMEASGVILPGRVGFRARNARVLAVARNVRKSSKTFEACRASYPDVEFFDSPQELIEAYPPQDVEGIKPPPPDYVSKVHQAIDQLERRRPHARATLYVPEEAYPILEPEFDDPIVGGGPWWSLGQTIRGVPVSIDRGTRAPYIRVFVQIS